MKFQNATIIQAKFIAPAATLVLGVVAIGVLYFYRPWGLFFLNDDLIHIPLSEQKIFGQHNSIRAGNDFSLFFDTLLFGKNATGYHLTNLAIHILSCLALFFFVRQLVSSFGGQRLSPLPALSVFLFFIYPFHSESVYWIIGRTGSLSALFLFTSLIFYHKAHKGLKFQLLATLFFACSLSVYESVWIFPVAILWSVIFQVKSGNRQIGPFIRTAILFSIVFIAFLAIRYRVQSEVLGAYELEKISNNSPAFHLVLNYGRLLLRSIAIPQKSTFSFIIVGLFAFISILVWILISFRRGANSFWLLFSLSCFLFSLFPYITLGIDTHGTESERYLYLPSFFFCILLGTLICNINDVKVRSLILSAVSVYFFIALGISSKNYRLASSIVQNTFEVLKYVPNGKTVIFRNVPRDNRGAIMLGLGLQEGFDWLSGKNKNVTLLVENYTTNDRFFREANIEYTKITDDQHIQGDFLNPRNGQTTQMEIHSSQVWIVTYHSGGIIVQKPN